MIYFSALAFLMLVIPLTGFFPVVKRGRAFNAIFHIAMPDPEKVYFEAWNPILVQEKIEWWVSWVGAFVIATPLAVALSWFTPLGFVSPILPVLAWNWRKTDWGRAQIEYLGWASEWVYAEKTNNPHASYRDFNLYGDKLKGGYLVFKSVSSHSVTRRLKKRLGVARVLVALHSFSIKRHAVRSGAASIA